MRVRSTRHGVVIDDFARKPDEYSPAGHVLALQATALDGGDTSLEGLLRISQAQNWNDFLDAARKVVTPMQNVVYADTAGQHRPGVAGARADPAQGRRLDAARPAGPANTTGRASCRSTTCRGPTIRRAASSSTPTPALVPDDYRYFITRDWAEPYRQRRANQLLREVERHPVYGMIAIQADNLSPDAAEMLPLLLKRRAAQRRAPPRCASMMGRWNRFMLARRPEPLIYDAWIWELQRGLLADRLGERAVLRPRHAQCAADAAHPARQARLVRRPQDARPSRNLRRRDRGRARRGARLDRAPRRAPTSTAGNGAASISPRTAIRLFDAVPLLRDVASVRFPSDGGAHTLNRATSGLPRRAAVRGGARRGLPRGLRFQRSRQQPLRHPARPVGQHDVALVAQLRR